jgi:quercetin dioxygenase-like cupin family protein
MLVVHEIARAMFSLTIAGSLLAACQQPPQSRQTPVERNALASPPADRSSVTPAKSIAAAQVFPNQYVGNAMATPFVNPTAQLAVSGALLSFDAGARTAWHSHPAGQTLFVTSGTGWVQEWNGTKIEIKSGDVVWTPPGVKHWHGATATSAMAHVAIQGVVDGKAVDWMETVTDEQYAAPK